MALKTKKKERDSEFTLEQVGGAAISICGVSLDLTKLATAFRSARIVKEHYIRIEPLDRTPNRTRNERFHVARSMKDIACHMAHIANEKDSHGYGLSLVAHNPDEVTLALLHRFIQIMTTIALITGGKPYHITVVSAFSAHPMVQQIQAFHHQQHMAYSTTVSFWHHYNQPQIHAQMLQHARPTFLYALLCTASTNRTDPGKKPGKNMLRKVENIVLAHPLDSLTYTFPDPPLQVQGQLLQKRATFKPPRAAPLDATQSLTDEWWRNELELQACSFGRLRQFSGTCWFNSVVNAFLLTPAISKILVDKYHSAETDRRWSQLVQRVKAFEWSAVHLKETCPPPDPTHTLLLIVYNVLVKRTKLLGNANAAKAMARTVLVADSADAALRARAQESMAKDNGYDPNRAILNLLGGLFDLRSGNGADFYVCEQYEVDGVISVGTCPRIIVTLGVRDRVPRTVECMSNAGKRMRHTYTLRTAIILTAATSDAHVITGLTCGSQQYMVDSNNHILQCAWLDACTGPGLSPMIFQYLPYLRDAGHTRVFIHNAFYVRDDDNGLEEDTQDWFAFISKKEQSQLLSEKVVNTTTPSNNNNNNNTANDDGDDDWFRFMTEETHREAPGIQDIHGQDSYRNHHTIGSKTKKINNSNNSFADQWNSI